MQKGKLYALMFSICICGYAWIAYCMNHNERQGLWQGCLSKQFLHIPCPSCGTTRSLMLIINGEWSEALRTNPLGYLASILLLAVPIWICRDMFMHSDSMFRAYRHILRLIGKPQVFIPLIILIIANWIWNIAKFT